MCHFRAQNDPFLLNNFFGTNHYYYFHLPIGPFHCAKFKKILTADPELWGCAIFGPKMVHLPQTNFFWKIINIILIYLLAPFIGQNFKKILPADPELWGCAIFGPKMAHFPKWEFFQKTCSWALFLLFMPIYMPMSLTWELDFSQACSFCRMLMNHRNFDFTQIPDKTNDMIFLKSPKTMFWGHFWPFLPDGDFFPRNPAVSHTTIYGPLTPC